MCCSLDYTFSLSFDLGGHHLVSTPSSYEAWLGIVYLRVLPNLMSFTLEVSCLGAQFYLSPLRLPIPPPPQNWLREWDLNPRSSGYEPDEITTSLSRDIR